MPTLFVNCRKCGSEFPTPIGESKPGSSGLIITGLELRCPKCGTADAYSTPDFHLPAGTAGPGGGRDKAEEDLTSEHNAKEEARQEKYAGLGIVPPEGRSPRVE